MKSIIHRLMPVRQKLVATGAGIPNTVMKPPYGYIAVSNGGNGPCAGAICHGLSPHAAAYLRSTVRM